MAARSVHVTLENRAGRINLVKFDHSLDHGEWTSLPPQIIGNRGDWESESDGFMTGTEGRVSYRMEDVDGNRLGELKLHWNNPFVGSNSYDESVAPAASDASDDGFSIAHVGGDGENANVRFVLFNGFCQADGDSFVCSTASHLTTDRPALYAGIWEQRPGPSWHAAHGLTSAEYQELFDNLTGQGFRPRRVDGYTVGNQDRYAAIFEQVDGPAFVARHGIESAAYQALFDELVPQGFRPICVSGYEVGGTTRFATVFEQRGGPAFAARHGLNAAQYQQTFDELTGQGFRLTYVNGYQSGGEDRFAAIFEQGDGPAFAARHGLTPAQYQQTFDQLVPQGFRPVCVNGYGSGGQDRYAALFEKREGPAFAARHGLSSSQYQQAFNELVGRGFRLVDVSGYAT